MAPHPACVDRLPELRKLAQRTGHWEPTESQPPATIRPNEALLLVNRYDPIRLHLRVITSRLERLDVALTRARTAAKESERATNQEEVRAIMEMLRQQAQGVKGELDQLKIQDERYGRARSVLGRIRLNLHRHWTRRLARVVDQLNAGADRSQQDIVKRERRLLRIMRPDLSGARLDEAAQQGRAEQLMRQVMISEEVRDIVADQELRHLDVLALERSITEIYELAKDLATLVDQQAECLNSIESNITSALNHTETGEKALEDAEDYQKKGRKKQCCLLWCCLIILLIILVPIFAVSAHNA